MRRILTHPDTYFYCISAYSAKQMQERMNTCRKYDVERSIYVPMQYRALALEDKWTNHKPGVHMVAEQRFAYIRVSSCPVYRVLTDLVSGESRVNRLELVECPGYLRDGDEFAVASIERLAR